MDPSLGMAEFISNSAILPPIRHRARAYRSGLFRPKARKLADFGVKSANR